MNIRRLFSNDFLTWDEYKDLVYTIEFIHEINTIRIPKLSSKTKIRR